MILSFSLLTFHRSCTTLFNVERRGVTPIPEAHTITSLYLRKERKKERKKERRNERKKESSHTCIRMQYHTHSTQHTSHSIHNTHSIHSVLSLSPLVLLFSSYSVMCCVGELNGPIARIMRLFLISVSFPRYCFRESSPFD